MKYKKPRLAVEEQANLLIKRGLVTTNRDLLIDRLRVVSYYRLSGYWHVFRKPDPIQTGQYLDDFRPGTNFDMVWNRYAFDRHLRLVVMDALERIEIVVRTTLAYHHAHDHGPFGYATDPNSLPDLAKDKRKQARFLTSILNESGRSKDIFVKHFNRHYGSDHYHLPIWMAVEIMSFGSVFTLYRGCSSIIRQKVASTFGVDDTVFETWLMTLNTVRNICAHHGRLWNREIGTKPKIPKKDSNWHTPVEISNNRMFCVLTICKWSLDRIAPQSCWTGRLRALLAKNPDIPLAKMGFPDDWEKSPVWGRTSIHLDKS